MFKKLFKKLTSGALLTYAGYEAGKKFDDQPMVIQPNITVSVPENFEKSIEPNEVIVILIVIIAGLWALLFAKQCFGKYIKRQPQQPQQAIPLQRVNP